MTNWKYKVKLKYLFTNKEDYASLYISMNLIGNELAKHDIFKSFIAEHKEAFGNIPNDAKYNKLFTPLAYCNALLAKLYDYADNNLIWID